MISPNPESVYASLPTRGPTVRRPRDCASQTIPGPARALSTLANPPTTSPARRGASRTGTGRPSTCSTVEINSRTVTPLPVPILMMVLDSPVCSRTSSNRSTAYACARRPWRICSGRSSIRIHASSRGIELPEAYIYSLNDELTLSLKDSLLMQSYSTRFRGKWRYTTILLIEKPWNNGGNPFNSIRRRN
jgi:hypothetical protein